MEEIAADDSDWLLLTSSEDFPGYWTVKCLDPAFIFDFEELIGPYKLVSPLGFGEFVSLAEELDYKWAFVEDPQSIFDNFNKLNSPPPFSLNSTAEGTTQGFWPWQLQAFNKLKDLPGGKIIHGTGTGKTAVASALIRYHLDNFDICFFFVKAHNKYNTQRKLQKFVGIDSIVLDGVIDKRLAIYKEIYQNLSEGEKVVVISNYEKVRDDELAIRTLVTDRRVLFLYDEMPTKLSNRDTLLTNSFLRTIYRTKEDKPDSIPNPLKSKLRVKEYRAYEMSATPIERDIEGDFNCTRFIAPEVFGPVQNFRNEFVLSYNFFNKHLPEEFHNLDKFALKQSHITHIANKKDPDIARFFPKAIFDPIVIDWDQKDRNVYEALIEKGKSFVDEGNILSVIGVLQMFCDAPSMLNKSAKNRAQFELDFMSLGEYATKKGSALALDFITSIERELDDKTHTKLKTLKDLITTTHSNERILVYTIFNSLLLPILSDHFDEWDVSYVVYKGTSKQKDAVLQRYREDDSIQVFLSSDAGSDSIDLEMASVGIDYDLPWNWTKLLQRQNRANRPTSKHKQQVFYTLSMADSVEDRKWEIVDSKRDQHEAVYEGKANEQSRVSRMSKEDLLYILGNFN